MDSIMEQMLELLQPDCISRDKCYNFMETLFSAILFDFCLNLRSLFF